MTAKNKFFILLSILLVCGWVCSPSRAQETRILTLDSCLQLARTNNPKIRKASLETEKAKQVRMQAMTKYFPQVQAMSAGYHALHPVFEISIDDIGDDELREVMQTLYNQFGDALGVDGKFSLFRYGYTAGVSAVQPVFMGGRIIAGNQLAKMGVQAAELQQQITERDLLEEVEQSYWMVVGLQDKQQTLEHMHRLMDTIHHTVSVAIEAGLALRSDLMQVEAHQAELRAQTIRLQSGIRLATKALGLSIGIDMDNVELVDSVVYETQDDALLIPSSGNTPEHDLLALQTRAARWQRVMTIGEALPQIAVGAHYGYNHLEAAMMRNGMGGHNGAMFVTVNVPLTGWWETGHKIREKSLTIQQAELDQQTMGDQLALRNEQAYVQMVTQQLLVEEAERMVALAREQYRLMNLDYRSGSATVNELLLSEGQLLKALNDRTDAVIALRLFTRRYQDLNQ